MELADEIALLPPGPKKLPFVASLRLTQESLHSVVREHSLQHLGPVDDKEPSRMRVNLGAKTFQVGEQVFKLLAVDELNPCEAFCPHSNSQSFLRLGDVKTKLRVQRNLDDKEGARVKEKFLGAEKKANSHKAQLLDGSTRVVTGQHTPRIVKEIGSANSSKAKAAGETYSAQKNQAVNRSMARQGRGSTVPPPAGAKGSPNAAGGRDVEPKKHVPHAKRKLASRVRPRSAVGSASGPGLENDKRMRRKLINALRTRPMSLKSLGKELGGVNAQTLVPTLQLVADFKAPGYYHLKPEYQDAVSGESDDQQLQMGAVLDSNQSRAVDGPPNKRQKRQTPEETRETAGQAASGVGSSLEQIRRAGGVVPKLEFGGVDPEFFAKYEDVKAHPRPPVANREMLEKYSSEFSSKHAVYIMLDKELDRNDKEFRTLFKQKEGLGSDSAGQEKVSSAIRHLYKQRKKRVKRMKKTFKRLHQDLQILKDCIKEYTRAKT